MIENRPGAGGTLGNEAVARADKDGYTLGIMTAGQILHVPFRTSPEAKEMEVDMRGAENVEPEM